MTVRRLRHFWAAGGMVCSEASHTTPQEARVVAAELVRIATDPASTAAAARSCTELLIDLIPAIREANLGQQEIAA